MTGCCPGQDPQWATLAKEDVLSDELSEQLQTWSERGLVGSRLFESLLESDSLCALAIALVRFGIHSPPLARLKQSQRRFLIDSIIVRKELLSLRLFPSEGDDAVAGFVTPAGMASGRNHAELVVLFECRERQALASTAGAEPPRRIAHKRLGCSLGFRMASFPVRAAGGSLVQCLVPSGGGLQTHRWTMVPRVHMPPLDRTATRPPTSSGSRCAGSCAT